MRKTIYYLEFEQCNVSWLIDILRCVFCIERLGDDSASDSVNDLCLCLNALPNSNHCGSSSDTHTHTQTHTYEHTQPHTPTNAHAHTITLANAHAQTPHAHTHTQ